jgi:hypothetical protein
MLAHLTPLDLGLVLALLVVAAVLVGGARWAERRRK